MAIAQAGVTIVPTEETSLPSIIKGLKLAAGRHFDPRRRSGRFAIQRSIYLLQGLGYRPAMRYQFKTYHEGAYSNKLGEELEKIDGNAMRRAIPDITIAEEYPLLVSALQRGDRFVQVLGSTYHIRLINVGFSKEELIQFQSEKEPDFIILIKEVWTFMEVTDWPVISR